MTSLSDSFEACLWYSAKRSRQNRCKKHLATHSSLSSRPLRGLQHSLARMCLTAGALASSQCSHFTFFEGEELLSGLSASLPTTPV